MILGSRTSQWSRCRLLCEAIEDQQAIQGLVFPTKQQAAGQDARVLSKIIVIIRMGFQWQAAPLGFGPAKMLSTL